MKRTRVELDDNFSYVEIRVEQEADGLWYYVSDFTFLRVQGIRIDESGFKTAEKAYQFAYKELFDDLDQYIFHVSDKVLFEKFFNHHAGNSDLWFTNLFINVV